MKLFFLILLAGWMSIVADDMDFFQHLKNKEDIKRISLNQYVEEEKYHIRIKNHPEHVGILASLKKSEHSNKNFLCLVFNKEGDLVFKKEGRIIYDLFFSDRIFNFSWHDESDSNCYKNRLHKNTLYDYRGIVLGDYYLPGDYKLSEDGRFGLYGQDLSIWEGYPWGLYDFEKKQMTTRQDLINAGMEPHHALNAEYFDNEHLFIFGSRNTYNFSESDVEAYQKEFKHSIEALAEYKKGSGSRPPATEIKKRLAPIGTLNFCYLFNTIEKKIVKKKHLITENTFELHMSDNYKVLKSGKEVYLAVTGRCRNTDDSLPLRFRHGYNSVIILDKNLDIVFQFYESRGPILNVYLVNKDKFLVVAADSILIVEQNKISKKIKTPGVEINFRPMLRESAYFFKKDNIISIHSHPSGLIKKAQAILFDVENLENPKYGQLESVKFANDFVVWEGNELKFKRVKD